MSSPTRKHAGPSTASNQPTAAEPSFAERARTWYDFRGVAYRSGQMARCHVVARQLQERRQFIRDSPGDQSDTEDGVVYDAQDSSRDGTRLLRKIDWRNRSR